MTLTPRLKYSWFSLLKELQVDKQLGEVIFQNLCDVYSDADRHYHNLEHIQHLLDLIAEVEDISECFVGLQFAVWFHDYIYVSLNHENELKSALYAETTLNKFNIDLDTIKLVKQIIISTQKHQPLMQSIDNLIFLDVDLAILGVPVDRYKEYAQKIRKEYSFLGDRDYKQGRKRVLASFISRPRIYYTDYFYQQLEQQARQNLEAELNTLGVESWK